MEKRRKNKLLPIQSMEGFGREITHPAVERLTRDLARPIREFLAQGVIDGLYEWEEVDEEKIDESDDKKARAYYKDHYKSFKLYHDQLERGEKTSLQIVADDAHLGIDRVKRLHRHCPLRSCQERKQQRNARRAKGTQAKSLEPKSDPIEPGDPTAQI